MVGGKCWIIVTLLLISLFLGGNKTYAALPKLDYGVAIKSALNARVTSDKQGYDKSANYFLEFAFDKKTSTNTSVRDYDLSRGAQGSTIYLNYRYKSVDPVKLQMRLNSTKQSEYNTISTIERGENIPLASLPAAAEWTDVEIPVDFHKFRLASSGKKYQFPKALLEPRQGTSGNGVVKGCFPAESYQLVLEATSGIDGNFSDKAKYTQCITRLHLLDSGDKGTFKEWKSGMLNVPSWGESIAGSYGLGARMAFLEGQTRNPKNLVKLWDMKNHQFFWGRETDWYFKDIYEDPFYLFYTDKTSMPLGSNERIREANRFQLPYQAEVESGKSTRIDENPMYYKMIPGTLEDYLPGVMYYTYTNSKGSTVRVTHANKNSLTSVSAWTLANKQLRLTSRCTVNVRLVSKYALAPLEGVEIEVYSDNTGSFPIGTFTTDDNGSFTIDKSYGIALNDKVYFKQKTTLPDFKPFPDLTMKTTPNDVNDIVLENEESVTSGYIGDVTDDQSSLTSLSASGGIVPRTKFRVTRDYSGSEAVVLSDTSVGSTWKTASLSPRLHGGEKIRLYFEAGGGNGLPVPTPDYVEKTVKDVTPPTATPVGADVIGEKLPTDWLETLDNIKDEFNVNPKHQKFEAKPDVMNDVQYISALSKYEKDHKQWQTDQARYGKELNDFNQGKISNKPVEPIEPKEPIEPSENDILEVIKEKVKQAKHGDQIEVTIDLYDEAKNVRKYKVNLNIIKESTVKVKFEDNKRKEIAQSVTLTGVIGSTLDLTKEKSVTDVIDDLEKNKNYLRFSFPTESPYVEDNSFNPYDVKAVEVKEQPYTVLIRFTGTLKIKKAPKSFNFKELKASYRQLETEVEDIDGDLVVWDNETHRAGWELSASFVSNFKHKGTGKELKSTLRLIRNIEGKDEVFELGGKGGSKVIHKEDFKKNPPTQTEWNLSDEWKQDKSKMMLTLHGQDIEELGAYEDAEIEWQLSSMPMY